MPKDTKSKHKKTAPIICAALMIGLLGILLGIIIYPMLNEANGELAAIAIIVVYGILILAMIVGIILALKQRLEEIKGGEEDEAKIY